MGELGEFCFDYNLTPLLLALIIGVFDISLWLIFLFIFFSESGERSWFGSYFWGGDLDFLLFFRLFPP